MNKYQYRDGPVFHAWSEMPCRSLVEHEPHAWSGEFTIYGPYMCWGNPHQGPKHRA